MQRYGVTIPFADVPLAEQRERIIELEQLGYTDLWSIESNGLDGLTPLALASTWAPSMRLGTAILPAYTRGPGLLAMSIASMCQAAPGRFVAGIGASSDVIVENWNGIPFTKPYQRVRDSVKFLRKALAGEKVTEQFETFAVNGFRLGVKLDQQPKIMVAALRQGMLRLAGKVGDGAILNWLSADDVKKVAPFVHESGPGKEIIAHIFVAPNPDKKQVRTMAKSWIAAYMNVPVYAAFHEWLGRGPQFSGMWDAWQKGDRKAAVAAIPDEVVDELVVHGTPAECRAHIKRYIDAGVDTPTLAIMPFGIDPRQAMRDLAPLESSVRALKIS